MTLANHRVGHFRVHNFTCSTANKMHCFLARKLLFGITRLENNLPVLIPPVLFYTSLKNVKNSGQLNL